MRIKEVKTIIVNANWRNWVFVKIYCDNDLVGIGEATLENFENEGKFCPSQKSFV
jgi:L-alanine-DL-glutamate epimerase-like enolase superfamily enzyme